MAFEMEVTTKSCPACDTTRPAENICSPYDRLTWAVYNFNYCPYCGRDLHSVTKGGETK